MFQIGINDGVEHPLLDDDAMDNASYSPDGMKVVFTREITKLWVTDSDGQNAHELIPVTEGAPPRWSPDGTRIAYVASVASVRHIWVTDLAGHTTDITPTAEAENPVWSPDGSRIFFQSNRTGNYDIFSMSSTGANQTNLTMRSGNQTDPQFSPDGNAVAYVSSTSTSSASIWRMGSDGSGQLMITAPVDGADGEPRWISNQQIIYTHSSTGIPNQLFVTSPQGTNQHIFAMSTGTYGQGRPTPSVDGKFVAWNESDSNQEAQIWYTPTSTIAPIRITNATNNVVRAWKACP